MSGIICGISIKVIQFIADVAIGGGEYLACFSDISAKYNVQFL